MLVRVVRVACLPGGLSMFVDDQPDCMVIWVLKGEYTLSQAAAWEAALNTARNYWSRNPAQCAGRPSLRAV